MNKQNKLPSFLLLILLLVLAFLASILFGAKRLSISDFTTLLTNQSEITFATLIIQERIPRTIFSMLAGAALSISGAVMQAITRNPIADPSILGVNTGASLFVVVGITWFHIHTANQFIIYAIIGSALTAILVYSVGSLGPSGTTPIKLALSGAAVSAALSSLVSAIILPRTEVMNTYRFWQVGSTGGANWEQIFSILPLLLIGLILSIFLAPYLNIMALGDEAATSLGIPTEQIRLLGASCGVLLCGTITAIAGPIGFVGLMVPHIIRNLSGTDMRYFIPLSAIGGSILLTGADVVGRVIGRPGELESGIVTAFLGAPILIYIARKSKVGTL